MRLALEAAGYEAAEAADGPRALDAFADGSGWNIVLLDQKMPGMDGLETLRHMKTRDPACRVIMVTAYASVELAVDAMKLGATDFVRKPMTPEILRNAVRAALTKPAPIPSVPADEEGGPAALPHVSRVTLNGFRFWPDPNSPRGSHPRSRCLIVIGPDGEQEHVEVEFDGAAVAALEQRAERDLPADSDVWIALAEHRLNAFLWDEGELPPAGLLRIDVTAIDVDAVKIAKAWEAGRWMW
jgi:DNA-binding response OmpR family regulator